MCFIKVVLGKAKMVLSKLSRFLWIYDAMFL